VPGPDPIRVPLAYPIARHDQALAAFVDTWIALKRKDGTLDAAYKHWILGQDAAKSFDDASFRTLDVNLDDIDARHADRAKVGIASTPWQNLPVQIGILVVEPAISSTSISRRGEHRVFIAVGESDRVDMNVRKPIPADLLAQDICERRVRFESMNLCVITRCIKAVLSDIGADIQEHRSVAMACNPRQQVENLRLIRPEKEHFAIDVAVQPAAEAASKRARLERHWPRWTGELEETMSHTYTQPLPSCGYSDDSFNCCGHSPRARCSGSYRDV